MTDQPMREMSLQEWVERLHPSHTARKEYNALLAAFDARQGREGEPSPWVYDQRIGMIAIYKGPQRNCLNGISRDSDCVFVAHGEKDASGGWIVTDEQIALAQRCFATLTTRQPLPAPDPYVTAAVAVAEAEDDMDRLTDEPPTMGVEFEVWQGEYNHVLAKLQAAFTAFRAAREARKGSA